MKEKRPSRQKLAQASDEIAELSYNVADYQSDKTALKGVAETHEQVSGVYMTGNNPFLS